MQGGTFNGNPLVCAAGLAVLDTLLAPGFMIDVREKGNYLANKLCRLSTVFGLGEVRGRGLLRALNTEQKDAGAIAGKAFESGLLVNAPRDTMRFMPALTVKEAEIDRMIVIIEEILTEPENPASRSAP